MHANCATSREGCRAGGNAHGCWDLQGEPAWRLTKAEGLQRREAPVLDSTEARWVVSDRTATSPDIRPARAVHRVPLAHLDRTAVACREPAHAAQRTGMRARLPGDAGAWGPNRTWSTLEQNGRRLPRVPQPWACHKRYSPRRSARHETESATRSPVVLDDRAAVVCLEWYAGPVTMQAGH